MDKKTMTNIKNLIIKIKELVLSNKRDTVSDDDILELKNVLKNFFGKIDFSTLTNFNTASNDEIIAFLEKVSVSSSQKEKKLEKKILKKLPPESEFGPFVKLLNTSAASFSEDILVESYQTFAGRCAYDKELLMNGGIPFLFNKKLKTIRLASFFNAVKHAGELDNLPSYSKKDFSRVLKEGRILRWNTKTNKDEIVFFRDIDKRDEYYYEVNYSQNLVIEHKSVPDVKGPFSEVFARLDNEYIFSINILELSYSEIIKDMLEPEISKDFIKNRKETISNRNNGDSSSLKMYTLEKIN